MARKLLLATLGTSPAVVTEAIDLLDEQGLRPDGVVLIYTDDPEVRDSLALLQEHLPRHCGISWVVPIPVGTRDDIDSTEAAVEFMQVVCTQIRTYRENYRLFVSIAGGRKAMSALMALAVQFYGAERLFHIWVPPWIEQDGEIRELRKLRLEEEIRERMHPPLDTDDRPRLVDLPFIALFPMLSDIREALAGRSLPSRDVKSILVGAGLLTGDGTPTELGERVREILDLVEALPPARSHEPKIHISPHHFKDHLERFAWELVGYAPFIQEVRGREWRRGQTGVRLHPPNGLIVGVHLGTDILFQLELFTTATTEGELEAARRHVERYVRRREG